MKPNNRCIICRPDPSLDSTGYCLLSPRTILPLIRGWYRSHCSGTSTTGVLWGQRGTLCPAFRQANSTGPCYRWRSSNLAYCSRSSPRDPSGGWDRITLSGTRAAEDVDETVERYTYPLKQRVRIFGGIVTRNVPEALAESTYCLTELEFRASL